MKNYIYTRVSTNAQEYEQQLRTIRIFLEQNGIVPDGVFEEKEHGTVAAENRELKNAIYACNDGDRIIVSEVSRISRLGEKDRHNIQNMLEKKGAVIYCINERFTVGGKSEQLSDNIMGLIHFSQAKTERDNISKRTKSALMSIKDVIERDGFYISKKTKRRVEILGNPNFTEEQRHKGRMKSAEVRQNRMRKNPVFVQSYKMAVLLREKNLKNEDIASELNAIGLRTPRGFEFIPASIPQLIRQGKKVLEGERNKG